MLTNCSLKRLKQKGQSIVELSLITPLVLIALMIPVDFAIMFQTGTRIQNAVRESARIAAAQSSYDDGVAESDLANRLFGYNVTSQDVQLLTGTGCTHVVTATAEVAYPFLFYRMMNWFGASIEPTVSVVRSSQMRYEFQPVTNSGAPCAPSP